MSMDIPFEVKDGKLVCKKCGTPFDSDVTGSKAFAAHWAEHKKQGIKTQDVAGISPEDMATLEKKWDMFHDREKTAVVKTLKQILADHSKIFTVYVPPPVDAKIQYGRMTYAEFTEIMDLPENDYIKKAIYFMLKKGDPTIEEKDFGEVDAMEATVIMGAIARNTPFLFQMTTSPKGSQSPQTVGSSESSTPCSATN